MLCSNSEDGLNATKVLFQCHKENNTKQLKRLSDGRLEGKMIYCTCLTKIGISQAEYSMSSCVIENIGIDGNLRSLAATSIMNYVPF